VTLDLPLLARGKVREVYDAGEGRLLLVASDRISAYDHVLPTPIPDKGRVLTALSVWWFEQLAPVLATHGASHHLLSADDVPAEVAGRAMLVRRLDMLPVECVARGYLSGSGTVEYRRTGSIRDVALPAGLVEGSRLPAPVFTPSTKAPVGEHDEAITFADVVELVGRPRAEALRGEQAPSSAAVRERVVAARERQAERLARFGLACNAQMTPRILREHAAATPSALRLLYDLHDRHRLSARGHGRVLRVARTIADLEGSDAVGPEHITMATGLRLETAALAAVA
jgi:phosphoribosylaminoimidazole-succinocarboxamide synthase